MALLPAPSLRLHCCVRGKNYASGKIGTRLDFVSFHAKGSPKVVGNHVRMNMGAQLRDAAEGFRIITSFPELRQLPIIIGPTPTMPWPRSIRPTWPGP